LSIHPPSLLDITPRTAFTGSHADSETSYTRCKKPSFLIVKVAQTSFRGENISKYLLLRRLRHSTSGPSHTTAAEHPRPSPCPGDAKVPGNSTHLSPVLAVLGAALRLVVLARVDANGGPRQDAVLDRITQQRVVEERIGRRVGRLVGQDTVLRVGQDALLVGVVWGRLLDLVDEALIEEELADVRDLAAREGVVREYLGAKVSNDVDVDAAASVVTPILS